MILRRHKKIRVISFDLDGTLVDLSFADAVWLEGMSKLLSQTEGIPEELARERLVALYNKIGDEDVRWYKLDFWFKELSIPGSPNELLLQYKHLIKPYPETHEILRTLASKFELVLLSHASREFLETELEKAKLEPYFSRVISTVSDLGEVKSQAVYEELCRILKVDTNEVLHIGDNKKFDYLVPSSIGINSFLVTRHNKIKDGINVLLNLKELVYLLENYQKEEK